MFKLVKNNISGFYSHIKLYFRRDNYLWYIMNDFNLPLRGEGLYNMKPEWVYDVYKNRLSNEDNMEGRMEYTVGWLSTKLVMDKDEEDMDNFFNSLVVVTSENKLPSLKIILMAWSIYKKHWYIFDESSTLHIIDHMANDIRLSYHSKYVRSPFKVNKNKLYFL